MRQPTKIEFAEANKRLHTENTVLSHAVSLLVRGVRPNAVETVKPADGGRYVYQAFDVTAAHGGILLVTFHYPGQRPSTTAHYLEGYLRDGRTVIEHRIAVERLRAKAHSLQHATL